MTWYDAALAALPYTFRSVDGPPGTPTNPNDLQAVADAIEATIYVRTKASVSKVSTSAVVHKPTTGKHGTPIVLRQDDGVSPDIESTQMWSLYGAVYVAANLHETMEFDTFVETLPIYPTPANDVSTMQALLRRRVQRAVEIVTDETVGAPRSDQTVYVYWNGRHFSPTLPNPEVVALQQAVPPPGENPARQETYDSIVGRLDEMKETMPSNAKEQRQMDTDLHELTEDLVEYVAENEGPEALDALATNIDIAPSVRDSIARHVYRYRRRTDPDNAEPMGLGTMVLVTSAAGSALASVIRFMVM